MSFISCGEDLPSHIEFDCNNFPKGGAPSLGIVLPGHGITDWTSPEQWAAAITAGKARIIGKIKFDMPLPNEVKVDNPVSCGATQILEGFDWVFHWMDANVNTFNDDFYKALNVTVAAFVFFNCDTETIKVVDKNVTFSARPLFPASNKEFQSYDVSGAVSTPPNYFPVTYTAPAGIFPTGD